VPHPGPPVHVVHPFIPPALFSLSGTVPRFRRLILPDGEPRAVGAMSWYRLSDKLADGLGAKQRMPIPLSKSPGTQTSHSTSSCTCSLDQAPTSSHPIFAVFEFPDELILFVLSYVSPDPGLAGHRARFRVQYIMEVSDDYRWRVAFLLPLSMTCRVMRLRLLPWIWERIEVFSGDWVRWEVLTRRSKAIVGALRADPGLHMNVKYFCALLSPGSGLILSPEGS
jgi:hypothetical protein